MCPADVACAMSILDYDEPQTYGRIIAREYIAVQIEHSQFERAAALRCAEHRIFVAGGSDRSQYQFASGSDRIIVRSL